MLRYAAAYVYKYVYKGPDMTLVAVETSDKNDKIKKFINSRFITASECIWGFFAFDVQGRNPHVQRLAVHEEGRQTVIFQEGKPSRSS